MKPSEMDRLLEMDPATWSCGYASIVYAAVQDTQRHFTGELLLRSGNMCVMFYLHVEMDTSVQKKYTLWLFRDQACTTPLLCADVTYICDDARTTTCTVVMKVAALETEAVGIIRLLHPFVLCFKRQMPAADVIEDALFRFDSTAAQTAEKLSGYRLGLSIQTLRTAVA